MNKICAALIGKFKDKFKVLLLDIVPTKVSFILISFVKFYQSWGIPLPRLRKTCISPINLLTYLNPFTQSLHRFVCQIDSSG